jgi:P-loop Domain of unknown function (DUF2791)
MTISPQRRADIVDALRNGAVPSRGLDYLAVGLGRFEAAITEELDRVRTGGAVFKAVRAEYGGGKTFFARWLGERGKRLGFAVSEVQINEAETPLHKLETVYRRLVERLSTSALETGALRSIIDGWFYTLDEDVLAAGGGRMDDVALAEATATLMEKRLTAIHQLSPMFPAALRAYRRAVAASDGPGAEALLAWIAGQPNITGKVIRDAGLRGSIDHFGALGFLRGLLFILRDSGHGGLIFVLDEVETIQRVRGDVREKSLNALRQLIDEMHSDRFPGLYLLITGTPAFFDGPQGIRRLPPLASRLHVDLSGDDRWDNPRAPQVRLSAFSIDSLVEAGRRVRDLYAVHSSAPDRIARLCDDPYLGLLAHAVAGGLGGKAGVAPRLFLKKLVGDVLDRIDQFPDFDPRQHYALTLSSAEMNDIEQAAFTVDDVDIPL